VPVGRPDLGRNTATPTNVTYRVGRIAPYLSGRWLDFGCAEGGYTTALLSHGARSVVGVDVDEARINEALARRIPNADFQPFDGTQLAFADGSFDGAFVNEVLEHVADEHDALDEIRRVLRPGGYLILISPNRWFPIEGHAISMGRVRFGPVPLIPWLPERLTRQWTEARNYWPRDLIRHACEAGFAVKEVGFIWPVLEQYPWLPRAAIAAYRRRMTRLDDIPGLRRFGISTLIVVVKP
jgi:2-polyprenyl-3-methyl-5-hydroxy-6-metoxy-1,4-benzoquinol methylase